MPPVPRLFAACGLAIALMGSAACSDDTPCAEVTAECAPLYEPTFDNVFTITLQQRCAVVGLACHAREGAQGGLVLAEIEESYDMLVGQNGHPRRVDEALGCGVLLSRLGSSDPSRVMPPSAPLSEAELCAVTRWVAMGAER